MSQFTQLLAVGALVAAGALVLAPAKQSSAPVPPPAPAEKAEPANPPAKPVVKQTPLPKIAKPKPIATPEKRATKQKKPAKPKTKKTAKPKAASNDAVCARARRERAKIAALPALERMAAGLKRMNETGTTMAEALETCRRCGIPCTI